MNNNPKAVIFDFGGTLMDDTPFDLEPAMEQLRSLAVNGQCVTTAQLCEIWERMNTFLKAARAGGSPFRVESPLPALFRCVFDIAGLEFTQDMQELEYQFDMHDCVRTPTPFMHELIAFLNERQILTAVISNIEMTGAAMRRAIDDVYPENRFLHIITSADYCLTKPAPFMFEAAAKKLGVSTGDCFYCGDSFVSDVGGAKASGMQAVHYVREAEKALEISDGVITVNSWRALIDYLNGADCGG